MYPKFSNLLWLGGLLMSAPLWAADEIAMSAKQAQAMGVETAAPKAVGAAGGNALPGLVIVPNSQLFVVSAPLAGLVESLAVANGMPVKKGQPLARLQSPGLADLQRGYLQARTQAQLAKDSLERDDKLMRDGIVAESRFLAAKSRYDESAAALAERRQALRLAGVGDAALERLGKSGALSGTLEIVAPSDGVVLEQLATAGQRVEAAAPLYKVGRLKPLWIELQVPLALAGSLKGNEAVRLAGQPGSGKVIQVGRTVSEGSQTVLVRAEIRDGAENLRPGQYAEAQIVSAGAAGQWQVPAAALVRHLERAYVFVQTAGGFRAQAVTLLGETASGGLVGEGLSGTERIAVRGVATLKGMWQGIGKGGE
ncbi:MAG: efflux RND transporter periplasmic adaptor subunit [Sulfuricella sp.]|nr:efflux RND transporter periplasmic adaptor subunit [Sulfuricella sp.]